MRVPLSTILILAFIHVANSGLLGVVLNNTVDAVTGVTMELPSDAANAGCQLFADSVRQYPIKEPTIEDVSFQLRTPCGRREYAVSEASKLREDPDFDINKKTVVFNTGWLVTPDTDHVGDMEKAYHCRGGHNFIVVNTGGVLTNLYINSAYHTAKLGQFVAIGLKEMGIPYEDIHLIGHSLGAQTAGSAGRHFYEITGQKITRITGLDPARPCFFTPTVFPRIGRGDGEFVDIIHTNPGSLGTEEPLGNIDFYPGGLDVNKPGCDPLTPRCSHGRAIYYYDETVYPGHEMDYMGVKCNDYNELESKTCDGDPSEPMGYATPSSANGIYYLEVRAESPYGMNATSAIANDDCGVCNNN